MSLRVRLLLAITYVLLLAIIALEIPLAINLRDRVEAEVRSQSSSQAAVVAASASDLVEPPDKDSLRLLSEASSRTVNGRVLIVNSNGTVLADSGGQDQLGISYRTRPEIRAALNGASFQDTRESQTLDAAILATAAPIIRQGKIIGAVRVTQSVQAVHDSVRSVLLGFISIGVVVLLLGFGIAMIIARQFARPLRRLDEAARRVAGGDLTTLVPDEGAKEERSLARSFNEMTSRVDRLLRSQQQFVADASHQLRTPLTGLRLRIEEAQAAGVSDLAGEDLDEAIRELERLSTIVTDLLILSRAGERDVEGEALNPSEILKHVVANWRSAAAAQGKELELIVPENTGMTYCSEADLTRTLDALIENAIVYTPSEGTVTVELHEGEISVIDDGPGFDNEESEKVFERFYRGSASQGGKIKGTGLGLPIARAMMRRWQGDVSIVNDPARGARAKIKLPSSD